eukprot:2321558-Pyramimonas_sp.AAC.1
MGLEEWPARREMLQNLGFSSEIMAARCRETSRFGAGETAPAKQQVAFPVWVRLWRGKPRTVADIAEWF